MRKKLLIILVLMGSLQYSCSDFLDVVPDNIATLDIAFSSRHNARKYLYTLYSSVPNPASLSSNVALNGADEVWFNKSIEGRAGSRIAEGYQSASSPIMSRMQGRGRDNLYVGITNCNIFIENIDKVLEMEDYEKEQWKAEAKFLKAYFHFYLAKMYGPIVISDKVIPPSESTENIHAYRSNIDDTFNYIVGLLDEAMPNLPLRIQSEAEDLGRITKPIAAALKAEVLVTYASPLFNGNSIYSGFVDKEGNNMFPVNYDNTKWEKAAVATKEAIDLCAEAGIRLLNKNDYKPRFEISEFTQIKGALRSRVTEKWNPEIIWGFTGDTRSIEYESMPRLYHYITNPVGSRHAPTLRMAELYYTKNGVPIDEDLNYDYAHRFNLRESTDADKLRVELGQKTAILNFDRETRFYADLAFDRGVWFENGKVNEEDPWYVHNRKGEYSSVFEISQYSVTGYFPKKLVSLGTTVTSGRWLTTKHYSFPLMRLSSLYLYYAEALNESKGSPDAEVYQYVDMIRERSGLDGVVNSWALYSNNPSKPSTKEGMREIIRQERMIEMSFEGSRFWDIRRWKIAKDLMSTPIKGWSVLEQTADEYYTVRTLFRPRFSERDYLWPIPENEIIVNPNLIQNPGW